MSRSTLVTVEVPIPFELMMAIKQTKLHDLYDPSEMRDLISNVTESVIRTIKASSYEVKPADILNRALSPVCPATRSPLANSEESETEHEGTEQVPYKGRSLLSMDRPNNSAVLLIADQRKLKSSMRRKMEAQIIKAITETKTQSLRTTHENSHNPTFFEMAEHQVFGLVQVHPVSDREFQSGIFEIEYAVYRRDCIVDETHDDPQLRVQLHDVPWRRCGDTHQDLDEANAAAVKELRRILPDNPIIASSRGFTVRQEDSQDGPKYLCLEFAGVGIVEVAVLEKLRGVDRDFEVLNTEDDWASIPAYSLQQRREPLLGDQIDESTEGDLVFLDLELANEVAIRNWVDQTSGFVSAGEKQDRLEDLLRRSRDEGGRFRARTGKAREERLEIWVDSGRLVGPSASLRNHGLRKTQDIRD